LNNGNKIATEEEIKKEMEEAEKSKIKR